MKRILYSLLVASFALGITGCTRIEPGYVGIKVNQAGSDKGVENYPLQTGWVFYFPLTTRVYDYPTFQQSVIWCQSVGEGKAQDESISFNCKGGSSISADVSLSGKFVSDKIPYIFVKFRSEPQVIVDTYLRNEVRDALSRVASNYDPMDILGDKRTEFLTAVKKELDVKVGDWWTTDYVTFANKLRMDPRIEASINSIIEQKQQTQQSQLKVQQTQAEADQAAAKADGERRVKVANAEGEATAILTKARAQANANDLISKSLTPEVLQSIALEKWNGILPTVSGGGTVPFINVSPAAK